MPLECLSFFDDGKTILLGKEFRKRYNTFAWMEFGDKHEDGETLEKTACMDVDKDNGNFVAM